MLLEIVRNDKMGCFLGISVFLTRKVYENDYN